MPAIASARPLRYGPMPRQRIALYSAGSGCAAAGASAPAAAGLDGAACAAQNTRQDSASTGAARRIIGISPAVRDGGTAHPTHKRGTVKRAVGHRREKNQSAITRPSATYVVMPLC